jgi:hypothetical protein
MDDVIEISLLHLKYEDREREKACVFVQQKMMTRRRATAIMAVTSDHEDEEKVIAH